MSTTTAEDLKALFSADGQTWQDGTPVDWSRDPSVAKIVIGQPPSGDERKTIELAAPIPDDLASRYKHLTHLHLWQISNLDELPTLPEGLKCLDVRGCGELTRLASVPSSLNTLVLEECAQLLLDPDRDNTRLPNLEELSLRGTSSVDQYWIRAILEHALQLRRLDLTDCIQLQRVSQWPRGLVDIRLDGCRGLTLLPEWPETLERVGLNGAERLMTIPDFPSTLDYVDLRWTRSLCKLPKQRQRPRTLFLYGSGLQEPPASEHGTDETTNVAADVADYFRDVQLTGRGEIRRCKLLVLGNGAAGKTCLSLNLVGDDPRRAATLGTTHAVQFWDWNFEANVDSQRDEVHLHLWDFGGQEIYHNTHRLFMSKGTVFVVVWNPNQDNTPAENYGNGYVDERRPLQYWLDLIRLSCDHMPRIAIVCSYHSAKTVDLERQWKQQVRDEFHNVCECFYIDSWHETGERERLTDWLQDEVGQVIRTQGTAVPSYWEIAQEMVEEWTERLRRDPEFAAQNNSLPVDEFRERLWSRISSAAQAGSSGKYEKLRSAIAAGAFELTPNRIRRTLNFLTRSGWLYWDQNLFEGRVIVGQQWALDGLYTILERRELLDKVDVYRQLIRSAGRFSRSDLGKWGWDAYYSEDEQKLLISFMERCGLCFQIRESRYAWRGEDIYVSFEHLPTADELNLRSTFDFHVPDSKATTQTIDVPFLHRFDWQGCLIAAGRRYGANATYAEDGLYLRTEQNQSVLITCHIKQPAGIGGEIVIQVGGEGAQSVLDELVKEFKERFPKQHRPGRNPSAPTETIRSVQPRKEVFISYSWNSSTRPDQEYEAPADAIERFLQSHNCAIARSHGERAVDGTVDVLRDKSSIKRGDDISEFMRHGAKRPIVILLHSDRYWTSPNCIYELHQLDRELRTKKDKSFADVVIPVEHPTSGIDDVEAIERYVEFWKNYSGKTPPRLGWTKEQLKDLAIALVRNYATEINSLADINLRWQKGEAHVVEKLRERLDINTSLVDGPGGA